MWTRTTLQRSTRTAASFLTSYCCCATQLSRIGRGNAAAQSRLARPRFYTADAAGASASRKEKPYYITAPIFYVNAGPHVGHFYTLVLVDVLKRWQLLKGRDCKLCIGTDEYGMKVQQAAVAAKMPPKEFCDKGAELFQKLAQSADIKYDRFIRTTDSDHKDAVQHFWRLLKDRDLIYSGKHEGWYCVSDETFYPENSVEKIRDPQTGDLIMVSKETGKMVEWTSETNYHFRLSAMQDRLLKFYEENPNFVVPDARMNELMSSVKSGLRDLSISRPKDRLSWGVPVPDDDEHTVYVWLDALVNYITFAGFPWAPGRESWGGWPADVQVIGKDILRFHCIYWPAFLLALDIPPPKQVMAHSHWTMAHRKMAKSVGNVVNPFHSMQRFGVDPMRFYMCYDGILAKDTDYANEMIGARYYKLLQSQLGNLLNRVCSKSFNLEKAVLAAQDDGWLSMAEDEETMTQDPLYAAQRGLLLKLPEQVNKKMEDLDFSAALRPIFEAIAETHIFLHNTEPWLEKDEIKKRRIVYLSAEAARMAGILLQPFMPSKMKVFCDGLSISPERRSFDYAGFGTDFTYGVGSSGNRGRLFEPLQAPK